MAISKSQEKDLAYRLKSKKVAKELVKPSADSIQVAAEAASDVAAGNLQEVIAAIAARVKALEEAP